MGCCTKSYARDLCLAYFAFEKIYFCHILGSISLHQHSTYLQALFINGESNRAALQYFLLLSQYKMACLPSDVTSVLMFKLLCVQAHQGESQLWPRTISIWASRYAVVGDQICLFFFCGVFLATFCFCFIVYVVSSLFSFYTCGSRPRLLILSQLENLLHVDAVPGFGCSTKRWVCHSFVFAVVQRLLP